MMATVLDVPLPTGSCSALYAAHPMPSEKRQRKRDGRQARLEAERVAAKRAQRRRKVVTAVLVTLGVLAALIVISQTGGDDDETDVAAVDTGDTEDPVGTGSSDAPVAYGDTPCAPEDGVPEPVRSFDSPFEDCLAEGVDYGAELTTADGTIVFDLLEDGAPATVNNFVNLARSGFYDGSTFHRVIEGFVAQGGDPIGQPPGTGGPGYAVTDELPEAGAYEVGSVAMANSGADTQGSQFFVVTGDQGVALPPLYSLFATVTEGMEAVDAIALGEPPEAPTVIEAVTIVER